MIHSLRAALVLAFVFLLAGCAATGPRFIEVQGSLPELREGEGRVFFFRENKGMGAGVRPDVRLNGEVVGAPQPGSFFFVDRPAGHYTAQARTEAESSVSFELAAGESVYVSLQIGMGLLVGRPQLMVHPAAMGEAALPQLAYIGSIPLAPGQPHPVTGGAVRGGTQTPTPQGPGPAPQAATRRSPVTMDDLRGLLPAQGARP